MHFEQVQFQWKCALPKMNLNFLLFSHKLEHLQDTGYIWWQTAEVNSEFLHVHSNCQVILFK